MSKIKIISNPYKKEIKYQKWKIEDAEWISIDYSNNPNSKLLKQELTTGFFPFIAKKILDHIVKEYSCNDETLEIVFEGTNDEYRELDAVIEESHFMDVKLLQSDVGLENARDILPSVRELFQEMSPLILKSVEHDKIQKYLNRFTDASSDVVPICVLGNYSAGKSTFINALIGCEILPSGIEPITAKIYKISRSNFLDRACIKCKYLDIDIIIHFYEEETKFETNSMDNILLDSLKKELEKVKEHTIPVRVNTVLNVLNSFENKLELPKISDLIEVEIPFVHGVLAQTQHPFVVFDTPGSNSASNVRHLKVLKEAMSNMTNGLPIFLSTPDSLDSQDNENLYHIIRDMEELDSRFTMIVVNKADSAGIQRRGSTEEEQKYILNQAVPRNLYSGGLYYISSIMGLGAKTEGKFTDYVYEDVYDAQVDRYENPDNKHYRTLYAYNIQPTQMKRKADKMASQQTDLVYVNSGLFTIENEIEDFAGKYSSYNKCFQSQLFLNKIIQITNTEIDNTTLKCEGIRQEIWNQLENDKKKLINEMNNISNEYRDMYANNYQEYMKVYLNSADDFFQCKI